MQNIFPESTQEQFGLKLQSSHFLALANDTASKTSGTMRRLLSTTVTLGDDSGHLQKMTSTNYIKTLSNDFIAKVGVRTDSEDFVAIGVTRDFVQKCAYKWVGGGNKPETVEDGSLIDGTFRNILLKVLTEDLQSSLSAVASADIDHEVSVFDPSDLSLSSDVEILSCEMVYAFDNFTTTLHFVATAGFVASIQVEKKGQENRSFKDYLEQNLLKEIKVELGTVHLTTDEVKTLEVGAHVPVQHAGTVKLLVDGSDEVLANGTFGSDAESGQRMVKII